MTVPTEIILPKAEDEFTPQQKNYLNELVYRLEERIERVTMDANGTYLYANDAADTTTASQRVWKPEVFVETASTSSYSQQVGYTVRKGITVEAHFDIAYSSLTGTGNLYIELPYKVRKADGKPFVGTAQVSGITYTGDYVIWNAIPDTYRLELWAVTSAGATANVPHTSNASGTLIGSIIYIGQEDEGD